MGPDNGSLFANRHPLPAKGIYLPLAWFAENIAVIYVWDVVTMVIGLGFIRARGQNVSKFEAVVLCSLLNYCQA